MMNGEQPRSTGSSDVGSFVVLPNPSLPNQNATADSPATFGQLHGPRYVAQNVAIRHWLPHGNGPPIHEPKNRSCYVGTTLYFAQPQVKGGFISANVLENSEEVKF